MTLTTSCKKSEKTDELFSGSYVANEQADRQTMPNNISHKNLNLLPLRNLLDDVIDSSKFSNGRIF